MASWPKVPEHQVFAALTETLVDLRFYRSIVCKSQSNPIYWLIHHVTSESSSE